MRWQQNSPTVEQCSHRDLRIHLAMGLSHIEGFLKLLGKTEEFDGRGIVTQFLEELGNHLRTHH